MFVDQLSPEQKSALISLFTFVARADGRLDGKEWRYLNRFCEIHGLTYDINEELVLSEICKPFLLHKSKMIALVETVKMALSDLEYGESEQSCLKEIVKCMALDDDIFSTLNQWALDGLQWSQRGADLVNDLPTA